MVRRIEGPHASSSAFRPTGAKRSKACFPVFACVAKMQVSNIPARGLESHRRPGPTYFVRSDCEERGKAVSPPGATPGKPTVRQAQGGTARRSRKKQTPLGNREDRACNMAQRESRERSRPRRNACPRPTGVPLRENLENLRGWESKRRLRPVHPETTRRNGPRSIGTWPDAKSEGCRCVSQRL